MCGPSSMQFEKFLYFGNYKTATLFFIAISHKKGPLLPKDTTENEQVTGFPIFLKVGVTFLRTLPKWNKTIAIFRCWNFIRVRNFSLVSKTTKYVKSCIFYRSVIGNFCKGSVKCIYVLRRRFHFGEFSKQNFHIKRKELKRSAAESLTCMLFIWFSLIFCKRFNAKPNGWPNESWLAWNTSNTAFKNFYRWMKKIYWKCLKNLQTENVHHKPVGNSWMNSE